MICRKFLEIGEYAASGAYEEPQRGLFYRKALGIRRYYENCELYLYTGKPLYPSGVLNENIVIRPNYMNGLGYYGGHEKITQENKEYFDAFAAEFYVFKSKVPPQHTVAGDMYCHSMPNYGRIVREGFDSYAERIKNIKDTDLREGLLHLYEGIRCYVGRCVDLLKKSNADIKLIKALERVPLKGAESIYEAVVAWNFIMYLDNCDNLGCPAKELYPFYKGEDITELLECLYDNLNENNGYSMALGEDYNELTLQCLKAAKGKRRPMIELFVNRDTPQSVWDTAFEVMRSHGGQPAFYNANALLCGLRKRFDIPDSDIKGFCGGGCTESMIAGLSNVGSLDAGINLLLIFESTMYKYLKCTNSFAEFYERYLDEVKRVADEVMEGIRLSQKERAIVNPLPMRTLLIDDCIDKELDYNSGGARYNWSIINFAGMINVIDSMLVIRDMVFGKKEITTDSFLEGMKNSDASLLERCRSNEAVFGVDRNDVNELARDLSSRIYSMLDNKKTYYGSGFIPASIQFMSQVSAGEYIGATPDGRKSGAPLCDSLAAIFGKDKKGPTALLNSVTSLDLKKALGVPVLNFNIDESWNDDILKALILSYMECGGIQMQITCISAQMLKEAYENPELHKNLVVRVGGYSEYFYRLSDELKIMVMERSIQKTN